MWTSLEYLPLGSAFAIWPNGASKIFTTEGMHFSWPSNFHFCQEPGELPHGTYDTSEPSILFDGKQACSISLDQAACTHPISTGLCAVYTTVRIHPTAITVLTKLEVLAEPI